MVRRVGVCVVLMVAAGCGGQSPAPVDSPADPSRNSSAAAPAAPLPSTAAGEPVPGQPAGPVEPAVVETPFQLEDGFTLLQFADFEAFGAEPETWKATADGIFCSGKPRGYLYSKESYEDFTWRLEYRFPRPASLKDDAKFKGNTGFLVYITGEHKLWPVCLEVQGKHVQMAAIKENGGAQPVTATDDDAARQASRRSAGQWNVLEIISRGGALAVSLNGVPISKCEPDFLSEGRLGIQAEDHPFEVRRLRIRRDERLR